MSMIIAPSLADGSDMDVYEDAVESQENEIDFEEHVERHSANHHAGMIPATPPLPPTQFQEFLPNADPIPMLDTMPSTGQRMVSLSDHYEHHINAKKPLICKHEESEPIIKRMAVEVDKSMQLREKVYGLHRQVSELTDTGKCHLQREKDRAKAAVEEVEKRAVERDNQWKRHLAESISNTRVDMEKRIKDRD